jgi:UDP-3-O-[3-hydroxymyristoyl] glucosamine N-acyltransferase
MTLSEIAAALDARLAPDTPETGTTELTGVAGIEEAGPGQLSFVANRRYAALARTTKAGALIVAPDFPPVDVPTLRAANPYLAFARAVRLFYEPPAYPPQVHPTAVVHPSARIGRNASIGPCCVVAEDVEIGDNCVLVAHVVVYRGARIGRDFFAHSHAVVREFCQLGDGVVLQNGAVIGCDGFGFAKDERGRWEKIVQSGRVVLGDAVEVQAHACVDRASIGDTRLSDGVKVDNIVQIGHGSSVGEHTLLCAQVGLAGSTHVGRNVILAGQVGVAGHCRIGDGVIAMAQSGIPNDVAAGMKVCGTPAIDSGRFMRAAALFSRLPDLARTIRMLAGGRPAPQQDT